MPSRVVNHSGTDSAHCCRLISAVSPQQRGGVVLQASKSGHRVSPGRYMSTYVQSPGKASVPSVAGCWTATKSVCPSSENRGPHISAPTGTRKNILAAPAQRRPPYQWPHMPSAVPDAFAQFLTPGRLRPRDGLSGSTARLSGHANQPFSLVSSSSRRR